jgi:hypothetical protein
LRTLQAPAKNLILNIFNLSSPEIPRRHEPHYLIKCKATHGKAEIGYLAFWKLPPQASSVSSPEIEICHENSNTPKSTKTKTAGFL